MFLTSTLHFQSEGDFDSEMTTLLLSNMKNILNLLLLHLSTHRERVLAGIKMLAEMNQLAGEEKPLQMDSEKQMVSWHCLYCATSGSGVGQSLKKHLCSKYYL